MFTQQRLTIGAMTAFAVAFSYVSANALWYQPHEHSGAFFATRSTPQAHPVVAANDEGGEATATTSVNEPAERDTVIRLEAEQPIPPQRPSSQEEAAAAPGLPDATGDVPALAERSPPGEERIRLVQTALAGLDLYDDEIDGLNGPNTRQAVEAYQEMAGLSVTGTIDDGLLAELDLSDHAVGQDGDGANETSAEAEAQERQVAQLEMEPTPETDSIETASSQARPDGMEQRIRAGLKAFGNDGISADGPMDERMRSAIVEFQSLFGLEIDGQPSSEVYAKMQEIGLIN